MLKRVQQVFVILFLCFFNVGEVIAQYNEYPIRLFTKEVGLKYNFKSILQDNNNFIWIRYSNEIQRFDGANIDSFLKGESSNSLILDFDGNVWVSAAKNIYRFNSEKEVFEKINVEENTETKKILLEPYNDSIQFIADSGIYVYDDERNTFVKNKSKNYALDANLKLRWEYVSNFNHVLFYKINDSICTHNLNTGKKQYETVNDFRSVLAMSETEYIVNNWESKAWYYNTNSKRKHRLILDKNEPSLLIFDAIGIDKKTAYLASSKGLLSYNKNSNKLQSIRLSIKGRKFSTQRFNTIFKTKDNRVWASTENSLLYFNNSDNNFRFLSNDNHTTQFTSDVRRFAADEKGNLWLATINGLVYWDLQQDIFSTIYAEENAEDKLNHPSIRGLVYDGTNLIIGQTNKGIWLYNPKTKMFKRPSFENSASESLLKQKIEQDFVNDIYTLKNGNHIICARDGAYLIDGNTYKISQIKFSGENSNVKFSFEDSKGTIFIGTLSGLFCLDANFQEKYTIGNTQNVPPTYAILEFNDGYIIGTTKGVFYFSTNNNQSSIKPIIPELKEEWIRAIFKDTNGAIWFVSESKVHRYTPKTEIVNTFGYAENILGDFFHRSSFYRNHQGQVFIGGTNGINYFYPEKINAQSSELHPYIKSISIPKLDSTITNVTFPKLQHSNNNLQIEMSTPYFGNHSQLKYRYQLSKNSNWYNLDNSNTINLRGLGAGDYDLRIATSLDSKNWYTAAKSFEFKIIAPFWKRLWFIIASLLFVVFTIYKLYASFKKKLETEQLLNGFATSLYGQSTVDGILWDTARYCVQKLGFVDCIIYLIDKKRKVLVQKAAFGVKNPYGKEIINQLEIPLDKGIVGSVASSGESEIIANTEKDARYILDNEKALSEITVPIIVDGKVFAILDSEHPKRNFYKKHHLNLLEKIAIISSERLTKYLTEENLRSEIARDLHDEMGSTLTSIHIISKIAEQDAEDASVKKQFSQINRHTAGMMDKMSDLVWVVNPANDGLDVLIYRIREYAVEIAEPTGIRINFKDIHNAKDYKLTTAQRKNIYLIAKEVIHNSVKHSKATELLIDFKIKNKFLELRINDNGIGFDTSKNYSGNGIKNISTRADEIQMELKLESEKDKGTSLFLKLSLHNLKETAH